jgi:hypothetical protein
MQSQPINTHHKGLLATRFNYFKKKKKKEKKEVKTTNIKKGKS